MEEAMNEPNAKRSKRAANALAAANYREQGLDWRSAVADLLTDLQHLADEQGFDFDSALELSAANYSAEAEEVIILD